MHIIMLLLLGLKVALFGSSAYSLPIASSDIQVGYDDSPAKVKRYFSFENGEDSTLPTVLMPITPKPNARAEC